jgi:hypothetical protein
MQYWKPHIVVKKFTKDGVTYYKSGIKEVHYINDQPAMWSSEFRDCTNIEESVDESIGMTKSIMELYVTASNNIVYEEVTENGLEKLIPIMLQP